MKLDNLFARYPVFTREEYVAYMDSKGVLNSNTQRELLAYHVKNGHLTKIRRGFYGVVSRAVSNPKHMPIDPYLIAGRIVNDAVLSHHTALDFHGLAYSIYYQFYFNSHYGVKSFQYQNNTFSRIPFPKTLIAKKQELLAIQKRDRQGLDIYVTSLERTLVDVLDRPDLAGGWEEIWRSFETVSTLDLDLILQYSLVLDNSTTTAKVGFYLESRQKELAATEKHLAILERHIPRGKHYMDRGSHQNKKLIKRWNLIVPINVLKKNWEEDNDFI